MRSSTFQHLVLLSVGALVGGAQAAPITWSAAMNTSAAADVSTWGVVHEAVNLTQVVGSTTVNGVTFTNSDALLPLSTAPGTSFLNGNSTGDAAYDALLNGLDFGGGTAFSLLLGGGLLETGRQYELQLWFTDLRSCCSARTMTYGDGLGNTVDLGASTGGFGQFATGRFVADGASQTLNLQANGFANVHLTAYQLRTVPEPGSLALIALALGLMSQVRRRSGAR